MMSSTVLLSLLLINCVIAKLDLAKEEKEIEKFAKGEYPDATNEIAKQSLHLSEKVYDSIFEDMEAVLKNDKDKYGALINDFYIFIDNVLGTLKEKLKPNTEWGKMYESFVTKLVEVGHKKLEQVKATVEGKDVKHFSKENFMHDVVEVVNHGKKIAEQLEKDKDKQGIEAIEEGINLCKSTVSELAHIKTNKENKIEKTLIDGITVMIKKIIAFQQQFQKKLKP